MATGKKPRKPAPKQAKQDASKPKPKPAKTHAAKRPPPLKVLGNDPFLRGAAPREVAPDAPRAPPARADARPVTPGLAPPAPRPKGPKLEPLAQRPVSGAGVPSQPPRTSPPSWATGGPPPALPKGVVPTPRASSSASGKRPRQTPPRPEPWRVPPPATGTPPRPPTAGSGAAPSGTPPRPVQRPEAPPPTGTPPRPAAPAPRSTPPPAPAPLQVGSATGAGILPPPRTPPGNSAPLSPPVTAPRPPRPPRATPYSGTPRVDRATSLLNPSPAPHGGTPSLPSDPTPHANAPSVAADPTPHADAPSAQPLRGPTAHGGSPRVTVDPTPHAGAPSAQPLRGPTAHGGSPRVAVDPTPHADAPSAQPLRGPTAHGGSPRVTVDPTPHAGAPSAQPLRGPTAHGGSPRVAVDPVPHADAPVAQPPRPADATDTPPLAAPRSRSLASGAHHGAATGWLDAARSLFAAARTATGIASRSTETDRWGKDAALTARLRPLADLLYDKYWRVQVEGAEHLPTGPCILVANHAGALPLDGPVLHLALRRERPELPESRWLLEDQVFHAPFVGVLANRLGAVRASPENALRLLDEGRPLVVFPEGFHGLAKPFAERYQLRRFGRGGYVKVALRAKVPVIPVAIIGGEESMPLLGKLPGGMFGVQYLPLTLPPLPARWHIRIAPPVAFDGAPREPEQDLAWVERTNLAVRDQIEGMLTDMLQHRERIF